MRTLWTIVAVSRVMMANLIRPLFWTSIILMVSLSLQYVASMKSLPTEEEMTLSSRIDPVTASMMNESQVNQRNRRSNEDAIEKSKKCKVDMKMEKKKIRGKETDVEVPHCVRTDQPDQSCARYLCSCEYMAAPWEIIEACPHTCGAGGKYKTRRDVSRNVLCAAEAVQPCSFSTCPDDKADYGLIGGVVGGVLLLVIIIVIVIVCLLIQRQKAQHKNAQAAEEAAEGEGGAGGGGAGGKASKKQKGKSPGKTLSSSSTSPAEKQNASARISAKGGTSAAKRSKRSKGSKRSSIKK